MSEASGQVAGVGRVLVVGAGATGGFFGGRLARAGRDVTFLVRPRRAAVLRERGLRITGPDHTETVDPVLVTASELTGAERPYDVILLAVKAAGLTAALDDLTPAVREGTVLVPFLNGMAHLAVLNGRFGERTVLGGAVRLSTTLSPEGDVVALLPRASMTLGEQDGRVTPRATAAGDLLGGAGFDVSVSAGIIGDMWAKWVFVGSAGALTCLMRSTVGDIAAEPGGPELAARIVAEFGAVAAAAGSPLPDAALELVRSMLSQPGSEFASSMFRDLEAGLPVEAEPILGDLTARARALSVPTPVLDLATLHLRVYQRRRGLASGAARPPDPPTRTASA